MLRSVASPNKPPNVMIGDKHAKYKNKIVDTHFTEHASLMSLQYHGALRFKSSMRPPQNLWELKFFSLKLKNIKKNQIPSGSLQARVVLKMWHVLFSFFRWRWNTVLFCIFGNHFQSFFFWHYFFWWVYDNFQNRFNLAV